MAATTASRTGRSPDVRRFLARDAFSVVCQLALVGALYFIYHEGRMLAGNDVTRAVHNGSSLWHLERTLHVPSEQTVQDLVLGRRQVVQAANWYYLGAHFPVTIAFLAGLFVWRRRQYARVRNALAVSTALGLAIHIAYPLAPPRLVGDIDMVDTGSVFGPSPYNGAIRGAANQFAAMPSLHVGWAVLIGIVLWRLAPRGWRWLGVVHASLTTVVVVVTANHYWIDGAVGAAIVLLALWITRPRLALHAIDDADSARALTGRHPERAVGIPTAFFEPRAPVAVARPDPGATEIA